MTKYVKISAIIKAWGSTPYEWGLDEETDHNEVVRFRRQESGQWQLERERRGEWFAELQDLFDSSDVTSVPAEWTE
jgi:hypothetical protein